MNPNLTALQPYPFDQLNRLLDSVEPAKKPFISLALGEPKHQPPGFILEALNDRDLLTRGLATYPPTKGLPELRSAISQFIHRRFDPADADPEHHVLPVNGTREALFAVAQALASPSERPLTLLPNPFYQIYEGAALLAGTQPRYMSCLVENDFKPDIKNISDDIWQQVTGLFVQSRQPPWRPFIHRRVATMDWQSVGA
jgi:N-succinyldiaminopimelate aminotransferase